MSRSGVCKWGREGKWIRSTAEARAPDPELVERARKLHVDEKSSTGEIAEILGVSAATVAAWGNAAGWLRSQTEAAKLVHQSDPGIVERARKLHVDGKKTTEEVGAILGVSRDRVSAWGRAGGWLRSRSESLRLAHERGLR